MSIFGPIFGGGGGGASLGTALAQALGTAAAGSASLASREDHVHPIPSALALNVLSVPIDWNASTNTPALVTSTPPAANTAYVVTTSGTTNLNGIVVWNKGDIAYWDGVAVAWKRIGIDPVDTVTFAGLGTGDYDGHVKRVKDSWCNQAFRLEWDLANSVWNPLGGDQVYHVGTVTPVTNSAGLQTLTLPSVVHPSNFFRSGLAMLADLIAETSIAATARTCQLTIGSEDIVNLPTAANRRVAGRWGFIADGASSGVSMIKKDANEFDFPQQANGNVTPLTQAWSGSLTLSGSVSFTTAASSATAKVHRYKLHLLRG